MEAIELILLFYNLAIKRARAYADKLFGGITKGGVVWKGAVNYYSDLPADAAAGDCYTVKYAGSSGTKVDGTEYAWGNLDGTAQWIPMGPDVSGKIDKVPEASAGNIPVFDDTGGIVDSDSRPISISVDQMTIKIDY